MFSIAWSIAGGMDNDSRLKFDEFYKELLASKKAEYMPPADFKIESHIPPDHTVYDYFYEVCIKSINCYLWLLL